MKRKFGIFMVAALWSLSGLAADRPQAPAGFTWFSVPASHAGFLQPDAWTLETIKTDESVMYAFSSPTKLATCSISIIRGDGPIADPVKRVSDFVEGMRLVSAPVGLREKPGTMGPFHFAGGTFLESALSAQPHQTYTRMIVNPKTGTSYIIAFETLAARWSETWPTGRICTGLFTLDSDD